MSQLLASVLAVVELRVGRGTARWTPAAIGPTMPP